MMGDGMSSNYQILIALGSILLLGLAADAIGKRTIFPRVTLLLVFGIIIGEQFLDLIPTVTTLPRRMPSLLPRCCHS